MQALILAAGMGKRLKNFTKNNTKCMVKINGVRLIDRMLNQLSKINLDKIIIVDGYKKENLEKYLGNKWNNIPIQYISNLDYHKTNNIYSLKIASDELIKDDTILLESDIIFQDSIITNLIQSKYENVAVVDKYQNWMDGTCIQMDNDYNIINFIDKTKFDYNYLDSYYKTVNIYKFSKEFSKNNLVPFLDVYIKSISNNEYYEQVLKIITSIDKKLIKALPLNDEKWYEIDDIQDLNIAESIFCKPDTQIKKISERYGGYWRYPNIKDYTYLVNPYYPSEKMILEVKNSLDDLIRKYPSGQNINSLLVSKIFNLKNEFVAVGNGASEIINIWMNNSKGKVGFIYPTFEEYSNRISDDRKIVFNAPQSNGFRYTVDDIIQYFNNKSLSSIILINPDNPSGNFISKKDIFKLVIWAKNNNISILIDESFMDFAIDNYTLLNNVFLYANKHVSIIKSISKSYGIPGVRLGFIASGNKEIISTIKKHLSIWNINSIGEFFLQILDRYDSEYKISCKKLIYERYRFINELSKIKFLTVFPSEGNYVLCRVNKPFNVKSLLKRLWKKSFLIKDCSHKKGFSNSEFIRLAINSKDNNDKLLECLYEMQ